MDFGDLMNPLNPLSPLHPLHPLNPMNQPDSGPSGVSPGGAGDPMAGAVIFCAGVAIFIGLIVWDFVFEK